MVISVLANHAKIALTNRPWSNHFPPIRNVLGAKRCTKTFFNVLTLRWQNLSQIHRADLELWTETCHHVGFFRFGPEMGSTPRLGTILLGRILARINPSLQATYCHRGDASAQRAAPGRANFLSTSLRRRLFRRKFCHSSAGQPCNFCAHEPTLGSPLSSL